jgi:hypothetical protein
MPPGKLIFYDNIAMGLLLLIVLIRILLPNNFGGKYIRAIDLKFIFFLIFVIYILWRAYAN